MKIHNRWFQLVVSLIAMIMIANLQYAWTLFVKPLQDANGWKLSDVQWAFTLFVLFQTWVQPLQGWLIDRLGPRIFTTVAGVLCTIGWGGLGYVTTLPGLYTLYAVAGIGAALVYGGSIGLTLKWFKANRGLASGIMAAGFGAGAALFMPFISSTIETQGYQQAFISTGVLQGAVILVAAQFLRHPPAEPARPAPTGPTVRLGGHQYTTVEMLRTPQFWILYVTFVMIATGGLIVTANAGPMAKSWGISAAALTLATSLNALANGASRVFWGWVSDRTGRELAMGIAFTLQAICLVLVLTLGRLSGGLFTLTLVLTFFTWGEIYSLFPSLIGDYYGTKHATSNYGVMYSAKGVASIIAGGFAAQLYERFGSWTACFYGSAVLALLAAGVIFALRASSQAAHAPAAMPAPAK